MTAAHLQGIGFGLGTALCQSLYYLFVRRFVAHTNRSPVLLLVVSHVLMGAAAAVVLLVLWPRHLPEAAACAGPLAGAACFYLAAQFSLFHILRKVESSRVAPLLGTKIVVLAVLTVVFLRQGLGVQQWLAVALSAVAARLLNEAGGRLPLKYIALLSLTVLGYCLSDLSIGVLMRRLAGIGPTAPLLGAALTYVLCAGLTLPFAFRREARDPRVWAAAAPCAVAWFVAMVLLYACFGLLGVVFGNIVQATRGLMAVALGWAVARIGHTHIEAHAPRGVFWRRLGGAALVMAAMALYLCAR